MEIFKADIVSLNSLRIASLQQILVEVLLCSPGSHGEGEGGSLAIPQYIAVE